MSTPPENLEPTTPQPAVPGPAARPGITPPQIALVVGLLVVLLAIAAYFLFLRGGGAEEVTTPPAGSAVPAPTPEPVETPGGDDDEPPVETFELFAPRDPFEPLISAAGAGGDDAGGGGTQIDGGDTDGGTDIDGDGDVDGGTGDTDTGDGTNGSNVDGHRVKVVDVFRQNGRDRAQIQVDGTVYTVDEGENFADNFRLVSASGQCATMLFGDDEFTLCEGEEILK